MNPSKTNDCSLFQDGALMYLVKPFLTAALALFVGAAAMAATIDIAGVSDAPTAADQAGTTVGNVEFVANSGRVVHHQKSNFVGRTDCSARPQTADAGHDPRS